MRLLRLVSGLLVAPLGTLPVSYVATLVGHASFGWYPDHERQLAISWTFARFFVVVGFVIDLAVMPLAVRLWRDGDMPLAPLLKAGAAIGGGAACVVLILLFLVLPLWLLAIFAAVLGFLGVAYGAACAAVFWFVVLWTPSTQLISPN
jgi:hypothetical protein